MLVMFIATSASVHTAFTMLPKHPQEEKQSQRHKRHNWFLTFCAGDLSQVVREDTLSTQTQVCHGVHPQNILLWQLQEKGGFNFCFQVTMLAQTLIHCQTKMWDSKKRLSGTKLFPFHQPRWRDLFFFQLFFAQFYLQWDLLPLSKL